MRGGSPPARRGPGRGAAGRTGSPGPAAGEVLTLNVTFTAQDLATIRAAGQKVVILRSSAAGVTAAWLAFVPFQYNTVTWTDSFGAYASGTPPVPGNTLTPVASVDTVTPRCVYALSNGAFQPPTPNGALPPDQIELVNSPDNGRALTFGLTQAPAVNGAPAAPFCPVGAQVVPSGQAMFPALVNELTVLLRSETETAEVIQYVPVGTAAAVVQSQAITLTFSAAAPARSITYDGAAGTFVLSA